MSAVKTAISFDSELFEEMESAAKELGTSRSGFVGRAVRDYLRRLENKKLFEAMNEAHKGGLDPEDRQFLSGMKDKFDRLVDPW